MSITKTPKELHEDITRILNAAGSLEDELEWVAETLVRANLMGHDSHGVVRLPMYVERLENGELQPGAPFEVERDAPAMAVVNGNQGWGQVVARKAMELCIEKARYAGVATVAVRNSQHAGRAGEWPAMAAAENMIGQVYVNSRGGQGPVAPWGGIDRRLQANPMAFATPTGQDHPLLVDLTMSAVPEGKVQVAFHSGELLPEGCIIDADGNATQDPSVMFAPVPGAILPLGGPLGHKGYALDVLVDLMAGAVTGAGVSGQDAPGGNGLLFHVINIESFIPLEEFIATVEDLRAWVKSSRRRDGVDEILLPGEIEYRTAKGRRETGISLPAATWAEVTEAAARVGVELAE